MYSLVMWAETDFEGLFVLPKKKKEKFLHIFPAAKHRNSLISKDNIHQKSNASSLEMCIRQGNMMLR